MNLEMDLDGNWLNQVAVFANLAAKTHRSIRRGHFRFPASFGEGFAEAHIIEPGLSLCLLQLQCRHVLDIRFGGIPGSDLYYCRYELTGNSFIGQRAGYSLVRTLDKDTRMSELILVMSRQWMRDNLGLLAIPEGRLTAAYEAGLAYCSYHDRQQITHALRQRLTQPPAILSSLRHVISKGIILELISLSWSNLILLRRPNTYVNKIA